MWSKYKIAETAIQIPGRHLVHHVRKNLASQGDIAATLDDSPWYETRSSFCWWHGYPPQNDPQIPPWKKENSSKVPVRMGYVTSLEGAFFFHIFFSGNLWFQSKHPITSVKSTVMFKGIMHCALSLTRLTPQNETPILPWWSLFRWAPWLPMTCDNTCNCFLHL